MVQLWGNGHAYGAGDGVSGVGNGGGSGIEFGDSGGGSGGNSAYAH